MTWKDLAAVYPDFVQWVVQKYGPRHEARVSETEFERLRREYMKS